MTGTRETTSGHGKLFAALFDDAAVFPPGSMPVVDAVPAHAAHLASAYGETVGPLVVAPAHLNTVAAITEGAERASISVSVTTLVSGLLDVLRRADEIPAVALVGVEVALDPATEPGEVLPLIERAVAGRPLSVAVEVPRDGRRPEVIEVLAGTSYMAKLRTGGVRADLYPDETELAEALIALLARGVPFKATAGLHHAVRNTDLQTGFEQHGFLNLLVATAAAAEQQPLDSVVRVLADRDSTRVAAAAKCLDASVREQFRSFGTCSITEPVDELCALELWP